eukprot:3482620-Pleurochrysis_carterae.AAC.2
MNDTLAAAIIGAVRGAHPEPEAAPPCGHTGEETGGRVADGADLAGRVRRAVDAARAAPAPFA